MSKLIKTDADYSRWIQELKDRYRCAQIKAATRVNQELLRFYWSVGRDIVARDAENKYGSGLDVYKRQQWHRGRRSAVISVGSAASFIRNRRIAPPSVWWLFLTNW